MLLYIVWTGLLQFTHLWFTQLYHEKPPACAKCSSKTSDLNEKIFSSLPIVAYLHLIPITARSNVKVLLLTQSLAQISLILPEGPSYSLESFNGPLEFGSWPSFSTKG